MNDGSNLLLFNDGDGNRIIASASAKGRGLLKRRDTFFMDGTLKCCNTLFKQMYSIYANIGTFNDETKVIPGVFASLGGWLYIQANTPDEIKLSVFQ